MEAGRYRWVVLAVGTFAQASTAAFFLGLAAVTPALRSRYDLGVAGVGALVGVTSVGLVATLVAWGAATDRFGERGVMAVGLLGVAAALGAAAPVRSPITAGALLVPITAGALLVAVLRDRRLQRLSLAGGLLVVPQFLGSVLTVELLHDGRGVAATTAAGLLSLTQVLGAAGRLGNGVWSDRAGRLRPLRIVACAIAAGFAAAALAFAVAPVAVLAAVLVLAAALAISWNGLVFTAAGELAPPGRAATAMAMTNTANYVGGAVTGPLGGAVATAAGWPAMLLVGTVAAAGALLALRGVREGRPDTAPDPAHPTSGTPVA